MQAKPRSLPALRWRRWECGETKAPRFHRTAYVRDKQQREKYRILSTDYWSMHACKKTTQGQRRTTQKETVPSIHIRQRSVPIFTTRTGKPHDSWGAGKRTQKVLPQWWKIIHSKLFTSTALIYLTNLKSRIHNLQNYWRTTLYIQNLHTIVYQLPLSQKKSESKRIKLVFNSYVLE